MPSRVRIHRVLVLVLALALVPATLAHANQAYEQVSAAYAQGGGRLDPCAFTQAQLEDARAGIPKLVARFVPDLRKAIRDGIAAHESGDCKGIRPGTSTSSGSPAGGVQPPPETTTTPTSPTTAAPATPTTTAPSSDVPTTTVPPSAIAPQPSTATSTTPVPQTTVTPAARHRDRTAVAVALIVLGALLLLALLLWGWARLRGWDPGWAARVRHAWGEAGYRTTTTWSEFADWLRLGR